MTGEFSSKIILTTLIVNTSNNKWVNLREATKSQNSANTKKRKTNTSGFKGICFDKRRNRWDSYLTLDYKHMFLGSFDTPEEAHKAYSEATDKYFGEYGRAK